MNTLQYVGLNKPHQPDISLGGTSAHSIEPFFMQIAIPGTPLSKCLSNSLAVIMIYNEGVEKQKIITLVP